MIHINRAANRPGTGAEHGFSQAGKPLAHNGKGAFFGGCGYGPRGVDRGPR